MIEFDKLTEENVNAIFAGNIDNTSNGGWVMPANGVKTAVCDGSACLLDVCLHKEEEDSFGNPFTDETREYTLILAVRDDIVGEFSFKRDEKGVLYNIDGEKGGPQAPYMAGNDKPKLDGGFAGNYRNVCDYWKKHGYDTRESFEKLNRINKESPLDDAEFEAEL